MLNICVIPVSLWTVSQASMLMYMFNISAEYKTSNTYISVTDNKSMCYLHIKMSYIGFEGFYIAYIMFGLIKLRSNIAITKL